MPKMLWNSHRSHYLVSQIKEAQFFLAEAGYVLSILLQKYIVKNTLPKVLIENEPNKNDITSTQSIALVCCFCNSLQCYNATIIEAAAGKTDRPAETQLQLQRRWQRRWLLKTRLALEKLWDALNLFCGGTSACELRSCTHCIVTDN